MSALHSDGLDDHLDPLRRRAQQLLGDDAVADFVRTRGRAQLEAIEVAHAVAAADPDIRPWTPPCPAAEVPERSPRTQS